MEKNQGRPTTLRVDSILSRNFSQHLPLLGASWSPASAEHLGVQTTMNLELEET